MAPAIGYGGGEGFAVSPAAVAIPSITEKSWKLIVIIERTLMLFTYFLLKLILSYCISAIFFTFLDASIRMHLIFLHTNALSMYWLKGVFSKPPGKCIPAQNTKSY